MYVGNARASTDIVAVNPNGLATPFVVDSPLYTFAGLVFDDTQYLYAAESSNGKLYRIDSQGVVAELASFSEAYSLAFHKASRTLYVSDISENRIYAVALDGTSTVFADGLSARGLRFGPDGALYVSDWSTSPGRILRFRRSLRTEVHLTRQQELWWNVVPSWAYQVRWTTNLGSPEWSDLGGPVIATGTNASVSISFGGVPVRFFRVLLLDPVSF